VFSPDGSSIFIAGGDALIARLRFDPATGTIVGSPEIIPVPGVPGVRGLSISPDGSRLAFAGPGLNSQIWAQSVKDDGTPVGPARALTSDTSRRNSVPVVSPDGTRVAYMSARRGEAPNLWMMGIDGGSSMQLTSDRGFEGQPEWSVDGTRVAYQARGEDEERLLSIDIATRKTSEVIDLPRFAPRPGRRHTVRHLVGVGCHARRSRIAFSVREPPTVGRVLYTATLDPMSPRRLTSGPASVGYPAWSPDERRVAG
jgi:WD40 repeat protein